MNLVKLGRKDIDGGMTEVIMSVDGHRFTGTVPTTMIGTADELAMLEAMAKRVAAERERLQAITAPGQAVYGE